MAHAFTPHWVEHPLQGPEGPASWVFYVISQIDGQQRPLAVVIRQAITIANFEPSRGEDITPSCLRTLKIFSDPANRVAIESEVDIATDFYRESDNLSLPTAELPDFMKFTRSYGIHSDWNMPEFPFVSTCLLLGVGLPPSMSMSRSGPLGTVYRDKDIRHGLVVVDITDLDNIRFGIIAFTVRLMVWDEGHEWNLEGPIGTPVPTLENDRPRRPLSAAQYIAKFRYDSSPEVSELEKIPPIDVSVMDRKSIPLKMTLYQGLYQLTFET